MQKLMLRLSVLFAFLTIVGSVYVMITGGSASAGFAVIPMVFMLVFLVVHRVYKPKNDNL